MNSEEPLANIHAEAWRAYERRLVDLAPSLTRPTKTGATSSAIDADIYSAANLGPEDVHDVIWHGNVDPYGDPINRWLHTKSGTIGLEGNAYKKLKEISIDFHSHRDVRTALALQSVTERFLSWLVLDRNENMSLSSSIIEWASSVVVRQEYWVPIAHLIIEDSFTFGDVEFVKIRKEALDGMERTLIEKAGLPQLLICTQT